MIALLTVIIIIGGIDCNFTSCYDRGLVPCSSGECISLHKRCNAIPDCEDGSDEWFCKYSCTEKEYRCPDSKCIPNIFVCNGENECSDGSEEVGCIRVSGFCHDNPSFCSGHECTYRDGPARCFCAPGYRFDERQTRCKVVDGQNATVVYSDQNELRNVNVWSRTWPGIDSVRRRNVSAVGLFVFDLRDNYLVWHDMHEHRFLVAALDENKRPIERNEFWTRFSLPPPPHRMPSAPLKRSQHYVLVENIYSVDGLAIDYVHDLIYWSDSQRNVIEVAQVRDPTKRKKLVTADLNEPKGIALNVQESFILFVDAGSKRIEHVRTDGTDRRTVLGKNLECPSSIALDPQLNKVYFVDSKEFTLNVVDLDGQNHKVLLRNLMYLEDVKDLDLFEDRIFFCDRESKCILSVDKFNPESTLKLILHDLKSVVGCKVLHYSKQRSIVDDQCAQSGCEFLCLPRNDLNSHVCVCPRPLVLNSMDNRTCLEEDIAESRKMIDEQKRAIIILGVCSLLLCIYALMRAYKRMFDNHHALPDLETSLANRLIRRFSFHIPGSKWSH